MGRSGNPRLYLLTLRMPVDIKKDTINTNAHK